MFRFKQFSIEQDQCAMKVSTDGVLFGSWCRPASAKRILDIGTGTGLLSLMMAQKAATDTRITAVEVDESAAKQAGQNVNASPWSGKIQVVHSSIQDYAAQHMTAHDEEPFELIISNPPWFEHTPMASHNKHNQIRAESRTLARQQLGLTLSELLDICLTLLAAAGQMYLILPILAEAELLSLVKTRHIILLEKCNVSASPDHNPHCQMWRFVKGDSPQTSASVTFSNTNMEIKDLQRQYTKEFKALCRDFYLKF